MTQEQHVAVFQKHALNGIARATAALKNSVGAPDTERQPDVDDLIYHIGQARRWGVSEYDIKGVFIDEVNR